MTDHTTCGSLTIPAAWRLLYATDHGLPPVIDPDPVLSFGDALTIMSAELIRCVVESGHACAATPRLRIVTRERLADPEVREWLGEATLRVMGTMLGVATWLVLSCPTCHPEEAPC